MRLRDKAHGFMPLSLANTANRRTFCQPARHSGGMHVVTPEEYFSADLRPSWN